MSRIGSQPILLPEKIIVVINSQIVLVEGPMGKLSLTVHKLINVQNNKGKTIILRRNSETKEAKSLHGLFRSLIANMIHGVCVGYKRDLQINGVGYRAHMNGRDLHLSLGYSHPIIFQLLDGINAKIDIKKTKISLSGIDKQLLGITAAKIRSFRKPEPYRGKGIRYNDEIVKRKEGKSAKK